MLHEEDSILGDSLNINAKGLIDALHKNSSGLNAHTQEEVVRLITKDELTHHERKFAFRAADYSFQGNALGTVDVAVPPRVNNYIGGLSNLVFYINFSEDVVVGGTPQLNLFFDTANGQAASFLAKAESSNLVFTYEPLADDNVMDLPVENTIDLNGGTINDEQGRPVGLVLKVNVFSGVDVEAV